MRREHLEHLIRASADLADDDDIVVVGSQAILGRYPDAPSAMLTSVDGDLYPRNHPERAIAIEGAIGEGSPFHETFGYYAHGVGPETSKAPGGWEDRLITVSNENTRGARGWCLEPHDLVLSKCVAGREKDWSFLDEALRHRLVDADVLRSRLPLLPLDVEHRETVARSVEAWIVSAGSRGKTS
ncbi:MAG: DUF6036 family nucleotidyltransferase [Solirubrobacteraceae bacterium]